MFEKEEKLRRILCGKETQFCTNSMASRPDIMWCVNHCNIMSRILAIYGVGKSDGIEIGKEEELPEPPETDLYRYKNEESI